MSGDPANSAAADGAPASSLPAAVDAALLAEVTDLLVRYATGIDRRDWALFRGCFAEDCEADYGTIGGWRGADAITAWMERAHAGCGHTMHRVSNVALAPAGSGLADDGLAVRSYVDAVVMAADNRSGTQAVGYYDDELVRTDSGWKISRRRFTAVRVAQLGS